MRQFRTLYIDLIRKLKIEVEFRHVKAHSGINDSRSYVNEWCDAEAKKQMWSKVNSIKK